MSGVIGRAPGRGVLVLNVLTGAGAQSVTALAALWAIPQMLEVIGTSGYGAYSIATTLVGYFSIADLGLSNATLQRLSRARATDDLEAFGTVVGSSATLLGAVGFCLAAVLAVLAGPLGALLAGGGASASQQATVVASMRWCAIGTIPALVRPVFDAVVASSEQLAVSYAIATIANLVRTVGAVVAIWFWPNALTPVIVLVGATVFQFIALIPAAARSVPGIGARHIRVTSMELRSLLTISLPLWLSSGIAMIATQMDRLFVSGWFGLAAVGQYAVAQDLSTRLWLLPNVIGKAIFPRLARHLTHDPPEAHEQAIRAYGAAALIACTVPAVPLAICGPSVFAAWTSRVGLGDAPTVFSWMLLGMVVNCTSVAAFTVLQLKLHFRSLTVPYVVFLAAHATGCSILPRFFGPVGAAMSWAMANSVLAALLHAELRLRYHLHLLGDIARLLAAAAVVYIAMLAFERAFPWAPVNVNAGALRRLTRVAVHLAIWMAVGLAAALVAMGRLRWPRTLGSGST